MHDIDVLELAKEFAMTHRRKYGGPDSLIWQYTKEQIWRDIQPWDRDAIVAGITRVVQLLKDGHYSEDYK